MNIKKLISVVLLLMWMSVIFSFSNQQGESSGNTSKRVSKIIVNIIDIQKQYTEMEKEVLIETIEPVIRKLAHYTIYTIGGMVVANCVYQFCRKERVLIGASTIIGVLYAISDELHQLMIAGRSGNIRDVVIDSLGIVTGISFYLLVKETYYQKVTDNKRKKGGE